MEEKCLCIDHSSSCGDNKNVHSLKDCLAKTSSVLTNRKSPMSLSSSLSSSSSREDVCQDAEGNDGPIQGDNNLAVTSILKHSANEILLLKDDTDSSETESSVDLVNTQKIIENNCDDGITDIDSNNMENTEATPNEVLARSREQTIFLETPVIEEHQQHQVGFISDELEKASIPKRLNDEFAVTKDDCNDANNENNLLVINDAEHQRPTAGCSSSSASPTRNIVKFESIKIEKSPKSSVATSTSPIRECASMATADQQYQVEKHKKQHEKMSIRLKQMNISYSSSNKAVFTTKDHDDTSEVDSVEIAPPPPLSADDIESMDLIERRDFENEQRLTGGVIIKSCSITSNDKMNLSAIKSCLQQQPLRNNYISNYSEVLEFERNCAYKEHLSTATSSRASLNCRATKSTAKINISSSLSHVNHHQHQVRNKSIVASSSLHPKDEVQLKNNSIEVASSDIETVSAGTTSVDIGDSITSIVDNGINQHEEEQQQQQQQKTSNRDIGVVAPAPAELLFSNPNSNDSLNSEHSYTTSSNYASSQRSPQKQPESTDGCSRTNVLKSSIDYETKSTSKYLIDRGQQSDDMASTSSARCLYASTFKYIRNAYDKVSNEDAHSLENIEVDSNNTKSDDIIDVETVRGCRATNGTHFYPNSSQSGALNDGNRMQEPLLTDHLNENDFDDEAWPDCEGNSDEEICTCHHSSSCSESNSSIDNSFGSRCGGIEEDLSSAVASYQREKQVITSKEADLSSYIQMVSISEDDTASASVLENNENVAGDASSTIGSSPLPDLISVQQQQRKRKYNESLLSDIDNNSVSGEVLNSSGRKRVAYDFASTPRNSSSSLNVANISTSVVRRTSRSIIPTRDNPPPELQDWLVQFQRWSHAERLLALDRLIEHCEPTQVRHMMKVIEPQFQRDFISLLPRELALQVLTYLDPKDLLRAAQTCRSWRFLCDDNLLWKEKCRKAQILTEPRSDKPKRGRAGNMPPITSPWKAAYMRQHIIEMNWRSRPIRDPKVLKGHDDHVITCLQFSGNRIVSGSDDNTLKVWSAVTGRCLRTLVGHTGGVWSSQMSGNIIISGSTDRTLKVWDMESGQCVHTLLGHTSTVRCMHLHGKKVVSGSRDATLRVWDIEQGSCLHVLVGHLAAVRCVQYDGKLIVSGAYDYMVKIWHPERQECLHTLQGHTNRVYSLQFDGIHVVSGSLDTSIRVWDAETGNCKHTLMGHQSLTSGMELRQNILVSGNADSTVKVWDITSGQCLQTLSGPNKHQSAVTCLQFNSRFVVTSSDDGTVKLWDVKTGEFIRNLVALDSGGSGGVVWRIRANDTKLICAVGSRNGTEETKLMVLDFDVEGACVKCS